MLNDKGKFLSFFIILYNKKCGLLSFSCLLEFRFVDKIDY